MKQTHASNDQPIQNSARKNLEPSFRSRGMMKDFWGKVDGAILVMVVFLLVVFGMLLQKELGGSERLPLPTRQEIIKQQQKFKFEKEEGKRRRQDYQQRRGDVDVGVHDYQYAKRVKYEQNKKA